MEEPAVEQQMGDLELQENNNSSEEKEEKGAIVCFYCSISFNDRAELRAHCQTESHQNVIMSDEGNFILFYPFYRSLDMTNLPTS